MSFYIDLSEFLINPIKTGIQRIAGELCKHLPPWTAIPVRVRSGEYVALPRGLIDAIGKYFKDPRGCTDEIHRLGSVENGSRIQLLPHDIILVPEVFDNRERLAFFRHMSDEDFERCRFIVYDLLPLTHPEYFVWEGAVRLYPYFHLLRRARCCGFISEYTRNVYFERLRRAPARDGMVLPLGADSLGPRPGLPRLNRDLTFSVLGTIEPRKNHELILEAFAPLFGAVEGLTLSFIGKMGWVNSEFAQKVQALASDKNSGLRFFSAPDDGTIRRHIEQSRATIYVSAAEGYGLPPVESLWAGTPVIASAMVPSLERLGSQGIHYVEPLSVVSLRRAVLAFLDDRYANRKTKETVNLDLPTWRSFAHDVLTWCTRQ